ncbi:uncharacterized protein LOC108743061 isoform X2 [Agrilus planipennis]|nr:uncharacterized protein LOC108743061 isoform X2 [Agrilus planipennis]
MVKILTTTNPKIIGGWSQSLSQRPLEEFSVNSYGMVTNLNNFTTGSGWSPKETSAPQYGGVKILWTYGGEYCSPISRPVSADEVSQIVQMTLQNGWDGVDFDDECGMNIDNVIAAMQGLKKNGKQTSYGFISGWGYNNPEKNDNGQEFNDKVAKLARSNFCDRIIHYCYGDAMWSDVHIAANVRSALKRTINNGVPKEKVFLALTTVGLNFENLNYFLDAIFDFDIGGLFIWGYNDLVPEQRQLILAKLAQ